MPIHGNLDEVSLPDILQLVALGRKTGRLTVSQGTMEGHIYLDAGSVCHAAAANRRDRLGDILVKSGKITSDQLQEAVDRQTRNSTEEFKRVLLASGQIQRVELERYVQTQVEETVYYLLSWKSGDFTFDRDVRPDDQVYLVSLDSESLLLEGARRVDEWSEIAKKITSFDVVFRLAKNPLKSGAALTDEQRKLLPFIDGSQSLAAIVHETGMTEFDTGKAMYGLITAGFVQVVQELIAERHLTYRELLAYRLHQAEFADTERRQAASTHIVDCKDCSRRLKEIHHDSGELPIQRAPAEGTDARPSLTLAAPMLQERRGGQRRMGYDRRKSDRRRGDRRRVQATRVGPERRTGGDRRLAERRFGERRVFDRRTVVSGGKTKKASGAETATPGQKQHRRSSGGTPWLVTPKESNVMWRERQMAEREASKSKAPADVPSSRVKPPVESTPSQATEAGRSKTSTDELTTQVTPALDEAATQTTAASKSKASTDALTSQVKPAVEHTPPPKTETRQKPKDAPPPTRVHVAASPPAAPVVKPPKKPIPAARTRAPAASPPASKSKARVAARPAPAPARKKRGTPTVRTRRKRAKRRRLFGIAAVFVAAPIVAWLGWPFLQTLRPGAPDPISATVAGSGGAGDSTDTLSLAAAPAIPILSAGDPGATEDGVGSDAVADTPSIPEPAPQRDPSPPVATRPDRSQTTTSPPITTSTPPPAVADVPATVEEEPAPSPVTSEPEPEAIPASGPDVAQPEESLPEPEAASPAPVLRIADRPETESDPALVSGAWTRIGYEQAEALLNGPIVIVPRLEVESFGEPGTRGGDGLRIAQRLETGERLELIVTSPDFLRGGSDTPNITRAVAIRVLPPSGPGGEARGSVRLGAYLVSAKAPVTADSLRQLLASLIPPPR